VWVLVLMIGANLMSIAMTYSASGRFIVPVQPLLIALAAAMPVAAVHRGLQLLRPYRDLERQPDASGTTDR
jgi:hypothetical protein